MQEFWDAVDVKPEHIPDILRGLSSPDEMQRKPSRVELSCQGVPVARYIRGQLDAIACPHARHNVQVSDIRMGAECPMCQGSGWLEAGGTQARQAATLALIVGRWKGIEIARMER